MTRRETVVVVGQGYVGLPISMAAVSAGFRVIGIDLDSRKIVNLGIGLPTTSDVDPAVLRQALASGQFLPTADYQNAAGFDYAVITVPTPLKGGAPDLSFVESAAQAIAPLITPGATVILESTTYPGTTEELVRPILEEQNGLSAGEDFFLGYSPERIDPGNSKWNLLNTPKVVSGLNDASLEKVRGFYQQLGISTVDVSGTREAEMTKLLENTFRHVNIALVNELLKFAKPLGVNIWEAIDAAATKPFGFMPFTPGPGVGGHCLPIDPSYLSWAIKNQSGEDFKFVSLANEVNNSMAAFVVERSRDILNRREGSLQGISILIVGLAYKPNTADMRESPAVSIFDVLSAQGASVFGMDHWVPEELWPVGLTPSAGASSESFDLAIIVTNHTDADVGLVTQLAKRVLDTRNSVRGSNVEQL